MTATLLIYQSIYVTTLIYNHEQWLQAAETTFLCRVLWKRSFVGALLVPSQLSLTHLDFKVSQLGCRTWYRVLFVVST